MAKTRLSSARAKTLTDAVADDPQDLVAALMSFGVIDLFEVIDVGIGDGQGFGTALTGAGLVTAAR